MCFHSALIPYLMGGPPATPPLRPTVHALIDRIEELHARNVPLRVRHHDRRTPQERWLPAVAAMVVHPESPDADLPSYCLNDPVIRALRRRLDDDA